MYCKTLYSLVVTSECIVTPHVLIFREDSHTYLIFCCCEFVKLSFVKKKIYRVIRPGRKSEFLSSTHRQRVSNERSRKGSNKISGKDLVLVQHWKLFTHSYRWLWSFHLRLSVRQPTGPRRAIRALPFQIRSTALRTTIRVIACDHRPIHKLCRT